MKLTPKQAWGVRKKISPFYFLIPLFYTFHDIQLDPRKPIICAYLVYN